MHGALQAGGGEGHGDAVGAVAATQQVVSVTSAGDEACGGASAPAETDSPRLASVACSSSISLLCLSMLSAVPGVDRPC